MTLSETNRPTMFFDSLCPVCSKEVVLLKKLDKKSKVDFIDIAGPDFEPEIYGLGMDDFIQSIRGLNHKGELIEGVEVFRVIYSELGFGWLINWSRLPVLNSLANAGYRAFAKIRPRFSNLECESDRCTIKNV